MKGDFTRDTFDRTSSFYRVLLQQGRVQLDADWNEQISILLHRFETMIVDVFGPHGGPESECGFAVFCNEFGDVCLSRGRYYVAGLLCENREIAKLDAPASLEAPDPPVAYIVYLDVFEQYVAAAQDSALAEVALGGLDTAGRTRICWQARYWPIEVQTAGEERPTREHWGRQWELALRDMAEAAAQRGSMRARASAQYGYTGPENQLYRVEIHRGGQAGDGGATWKWSRENGSVAFAISGIGSSVELHAGPRAPGAIATGDWVEITTDLDREDDDSKPALYRVTAAGASGSELSLDPMPSFKYQSETHPIVRRWDQRADADGDDLAASGGCLPLVEDQWLPLEAGVEVYFSSAEEERAPNRYRGGDFWLIPARTATGTIEWAEPSKEGVPPRGIRHRYAPLGGLVRRHHGLSHEHDFRLRRSPLPLLP
ncbi:MAG: DUF6519 domain-containing protein [Vulcanimicrobiaceae bacterium]